MSRTATRAYAWVSNLRLDPARGLVADFRLTALVGSVARRLPITLADARKMTAGDLLAATLQADCRDGNYSPDDERHRALGDYIRAREEIRSRDRRQT